MAHLWLSTTQRNTLLLAADHPQHHVIDFPPNLRGNARDKVLDALLWRKYVQRGNGTPRLTPAGLAVIGRTPTQLTAPLSAIATAAAAPREGSKQAQVIALLRRPEGATIAEIGALTQWQAHTIRGTFAGAFKKRGLTVISTKTDHADRVYRLT